MLSSCVPTVCAAVYSLGRAYKFGFDQGWLVAWRNVYTWCALMVVGRGDFPVKGAECNQKVLGEIVVGVVL